MKTTNFAIWILVALLAAGFTACKKDDMKITGPHMTLTTTKNIGDIIELRIFVDDEDQLDVWIDLNNNGKEDSGESDIDFSNFKKYTLGAKTVTVYGKIRAFYCNDNRLKALDVSGNISLEAMRCNDNLLTSLNISKNTELIWIHCNNNQITALDVSKNTKLEELKCQDNEISALDVSKNTKLEELWCHGNQITALDVSNNMKLEKLLCYNNSIFGNNMTSLVNSLPTRSLGDEGEFYVINRNGDANVCSVAQANIAKGKKWFVLDSTGAPYNGSK